MTWAMIHKRRVRYSDVDSQGIVFNGNYLTYYDDAIADLFLAAHLTPQVTHADGYDVVTAHASINFRTTATLFEELEVRVRIAKIGNTSIRFELESWVDDRITTDATIVYVTVDAKTFSPTPVPEQLVAAMQKLHPEPINR